MMYNTHIFVIEIIRIVPSNIVRVSVIVLCLGLSVAELCLPDDNVYYHTQLETCEKCDSCLRGAGKDRVDVNKKVRWDENYGALTCTPCIPCSNGHYNNRRAFRCQPCKNCSQENRYELLSCTRRQNAVCGDFIQTEVPVTYSTRESIPSESSYLLTWVISAVGSVLVFVAIIVCLLLLKKKLKQSEKKFTMNNLSESAQKVPLVVVDNKSNSSGQKWSKRNGNFSSNQERTNTFSPVADKSRNSFCNCETTPKVIVASGDDTREHQDRETTVHLNQGEQIYHQEHADTKGKINNLICCAATLDPSIEDVSKSSYICDSLDSSPETFLKERTSCNKNTARSKIEPCVFKRSDCRPLSNFSDLRNGNVNFPYISKCESNSTTV
ncbi:uncharacterized protein LOC127714737 isoform X2 [Mytilus californianus]|uniref:uncharacterized protein LOC127714737 isoform X2 n=1 Tax=Mytilus californianus TaxID=6549 RepID=UPI002246DEE4|nr:uncharacterized protein LOC127714737 isoform X2 [Mytilus californianus]